MGPSGDGEQSGGEGGGLFGGALTQCDVQDYGLTGEAQIAFYAVKTL